MVARLQVVFIYLLLFCCGHTNPLSHHFKEAIQRFVQRYTETDALPPNDNFIPEKLKDLIVGAIRQYDVQPRNTKLPKNVEAKVTFSFVEGVKQNGEQLKSFCDGRANAIFQQLPEHRRFGVILTPDFKEESEVLRTVLSIPAVWLREQTTADVYVVRCIKTENESLEVQTELINRTAFNLNGNFVETELVSAPPNCSFVSIALVLNNQWHNYHLPKHFGVANLQMDVEKFYMKNQRTRACNVYLGRAQPCCLWPINIHGFKFRECAGQQNGVKCEMTRYEPMLIYDINGKAILHKDATRCDIKKHKIT